MTRQARPAVPPHLVPMIDSFDLALSAERKSDRTRVTYGDAVRWLAGSLPAGVEWEDTCSDVTHLRAFFAALNEAGYSASYCNQVGRSLQQFYAWLSAEEDLPNPFAGRRLRVPPPPKPGTVRKPVIPTDHLVALVRDAERGKGFEARRDAAILRMFVATGCRLAELAGLQLPDVNLAMREVTVTGKAGKIRTVRIDAKAALALDRYLRERAKHRHATETRALWLGVRRRGGLTPDGVYQLIERRAKRLGLDIHPHLFRHTFAHRWLDAGGSEGDLMELAGWDSPQMLRHYGASARGARARRAYDRVSFLDGI